MQVTRRHLLLYDGACGFCQRTVRFVLARDRRRVFDLAALQSRAAAEHLARAGAAPGELTSVHVLEDYRGARPRLHRRGLASLLIAEELGGPWRAASVLRLVPATWLDAAYDLVARHRHRIPGTASTCLVTRPEDRSRFLDAGESRED